MKTMKRIFTLMLAILMCFMCLPFSASAESVEYPIVYTHEFTGEERYRGKITFYITEYSLDIYAYAESDLYKMSSYLTEDIVPEIPVGVASINIYMYGCVMQHISNVFNNLPYLRTVNIEGDVFTFENSFNNCPKLASVQFEDGYGYDLYYKNSFNNLSKNGVAWLAVVNPLEIGERYVVDSFGNTTLYHQTTLKRIKNFAVANGKNGITLTWDNPQGYSCSIYRGDKNDYDVWYHYQEEDCECGICIGNNTYSYNPDAPDGAYFCRFEYFSAKLENVYANTYVDRNVESGTTYYYFNNRGDKDNILAITYLDRPTVTVKATGSTTANISWKEVKGAEGYYVYQSTTGKKGSWTKIGNLSADKRSINAKKLFPETNYYFCVKAYKGKDISYGTTKTVKTNALAKTFTGFVSCGNDKYYAKNGKIQKSLTSMVKVDGKYYYVKKGALAKNSTGFVVYKDSKFYVKNGVSPTGKTLVKNKGKWYYVKNGKFAATSTGFVKYGNYNYYVKKGVAQTTSTTLVKVNGKWYYIKKGVYAAKSTGFVKYGNYKYYVKNGVVDFSKNGKVYYSGKYYTVKNGVMV